MAADEDKTTVEISDEASGGSAKKGGSKLLLFGGIGGALVIGIVVALFVLGPMMSSDGGSDEPAATSEHEGSSHGSSSGSESKGHGSKGHGSDPFLYAIEDIVVNPAGTGGQRFLSVSFGFELASSDLERQFESRDAQIRDALITIMSSKTVAQLTDVKQKEIARYQIKMRLQQLLATDGLEAVYYTDFVLQ